jgi:hypothetical protein
MSVSEFYECEFVEVCIFLEERSAANAEREQQEWDYVRHIMWSNLQPNASKEIKISSIIRLKRDGAMFKELTPYEQQELDRWSEACDEGMDLVDWDGNPIK